MQQLPRSSAELQNFTHTHTHTHTHARTHARTHAHTHTHTRRLHLPFKGYRMPSYMPPAGSGHRGIIKNHSRVKYCWHWKKSPTSGPIFTGDLQIDFLETLTKGNSLPTVCGSLPVLNFFWGPLIATCVGAVMRPEMSPPFLNQKVENVLREVCMQFGLLKTTLRFSGTLIPNIYAI